MMINKHSTPWQFRSVPGGYEVYMIKDKRRKSQGNTIIYDTFSDWRKADEIIKALNESRRRTNHEANV